jgi:hypothetical protein
VTINPWLAIDGSTEPLERARQLRQAWEKAVADGDLSAPGKCVRATIAASWRRSRDAGADPFQDRVGAVLDEDSEVSAHWQAHPLALAIPLIQDCLGLVANEAQHLIVVSDAHARLLWIEGDPRQRIAAADIINFTEGTTWDEARTGTNGVGTALAAEHAVQVFAAEHFNEAAQAWSCAGAPIRDPDSGELLGVLNITNCVKIAHPHNLTCVVATAQAVEADLRCAMHERDAHLRSRCGEMLDRGTRRALLSTSGRVLSEGDKPWLGATRVAIPKAGGELVLSSGVHAHAEPVGHGEGYLLRANQDRRSRPRLLLKVRLLGRDRAAVKLRGRTMQLSRRQTEVLALLATRLGGMTSEELAADLYGDRGQPATARVEVSRLRKLLGGAIETESYRLAAEIDSDYARVRNLLDRGEVLEAVEGYEGQLLPHSDAPGVARERATLDNWVRHAAVTADDREVLWAWVQRRSGQDDLPAWKRLLGQLDFNDPRRSLAAAQVKSLRTEYAIA